MLWCVMLIALYNNLCYAMTCYIAAGCYVNCVLGYDHICYVNMLHVLACTFFTREQQHLSTNITTGYAALDPTADEYLSGSGWEIMYVCCVCCCLYVVFFSKLFMFVFSVVICVCSIVNAKA